jgi:hypothetical protein
VKAIEKHVAAIQAALERVVADVVKRAHVRPDDDEDGPSGEGANHSTHVSGMKIDVNPRHAGAATTGPGGLGTVSLGAGGGSAARAKEAKTKSMAAARAEAERRAAALRAARAEEAALGALVRLADYMTVQTCARAAAAAFAALLAELTAPSDHRRATTGMFATAVRFMPLAPGEPPSRGTVFEPTCAEFHEMMNEVVGEVNKLTYFIFIRTVVLNSVLQAIKACTSTPRLLYARVFREHVQVINC